MPSLASYFDLLSTKALRDYLHEHENDDVQKLMLKQRDVFGVPAKYIAQLIGGRQKIKQKLPSWWGKADLLYPPSVNLEQASSEATAKFKRELIASIVGKGERGADLTGGFGIDAFFLSKQFSAFDYVEKNPELLEIARNNFDTLQAPGISCHLSAAENFITSSLSTFDFIYIDPSRRRGSQKVFKFADCEPDVSKFLATLFSKANLVMVKASPLLDIQQGVSELSHVSEVIVVAVDNECRELLFMIRKGFQGEPLIRAVDLRYDGSILREFAFKRTDELKAIAEFASPKTFVYEPGAALLKAGAFKYLSDAYKIPKLAPSTHLYTSDSKIDFPGRTFRILGTAKLDKTLRERFVNGQANILTRNYPLSVDEIKKKTGLKEGGEQYLIGTQDQSGKLVLVAERLNV